MSPRTLPSYRLLPLLLVVACTGAVGGGFEDSKDADGDTISNSDEGNLDPDKDGIESWQDDDSDGDCILDKDEAGDTDLATPPRRSDSDATPDFLDLDSDGDGLRDNEEDTNCNGIVDANETSARKADTDGDGASDLVESVAGTDGTDPADNPQANGDFVFEVPYMGTPSPEVDTLDFATEIARADVVFAMDTTGSMQGEINNLKSSVANLTSEIRQLIPDTAFGVVGYEDFPYGDYGLNFNQPFFREHRVMTTNTAAGLASIVGQVNKLLTFGERSGADYPESGWEMLFQVATGQGLNAGNASVPPFNAATEYPAVAPAGEELGEIGGVGFREGAFPIIIWMTDAPSHNSEETGSWYNFGGAATANSAIDALTAKSARVVGVLSTDSEDSARKDLLHAVRGTHASVPPEAWGPIGVRPSQCDQNRCCTRRNGDDRDTDSNGMCPLVFDIDGNGNGLGSTVAKAVQVLTQYADLDLATLAKDDPSDEVDATIFVDHVVANTTATTPCTAGLIAQDRALADGIAETFVNVPSGSRVCFDVVPASNTTVMPAAEPQTFVATISVIGEGVASLDTREVIFVVPPDVGRVD